MLNVRKTAAPDHGIPWYPTTSLILEAWLTEGALKLLPHQLHIRRQLLAIR